MADYPEGDNGSLAEQAATVTCTQVAEQSTATLSCPSGQVVKSITFGSYGTPTGSCPSFSQGACHASTSKSTLESLCLNKQSCSVAATNSTFGDPCVGTFKKLAVTYTCDAAGGSVNCTLNPYSSVNWSSFGQYKANYHTHTTNSDGADSPSKVISQYKDAGYSVLAITDHNRITWPWPTTPSGMLPVKGDEYSSSAHVGALLNFTESGNTLEKGIPHIQASGGMCNIHHPGRERDPSGWSWYIPWFRDFTCFGLEVFNQGDRYSNDRKLWDNINENYFKAHGRLVWGTSDDDKHATRHLYRNFQFMLMPSLSESNLRTSMRNGAFYFAYEPGGSGQAKVPRISNIVVNDSAKTITITSSGADSIYWVGPGTTTVATGATFDFSNYTKPFVRAVLDGSSGDSFTQPFGFQSN
jgi:hypothetical protein